MTILLLLSTMLSFLLCKLSIALLTKHSVLDIPNDRSNHKHAVPRGGGIAIMLTFVLVFYIYSLINPSMHLGALVIAIIIVGTISFVDDVKGASIILRSIFHLAAIVILLRSLGSGINPYLQAFFLVGLYVFINFYNFMDGIDGAATVGAIHIGFTAFIISFLNQSRSLAPEVPIIALIVIGASSSFLVFNWHPAKVFLGDVGSIVLGLVCGWLMINLFLSGYIAASIIIPMYYMADSFLTICIRLARKKKIWLAHSEHFFQKATRSGHSHAKVTGQIIVGNCLLSVLAVLSTRYQIASLIVASMTVLALLCNFQVSFSKQR